VVAGRGNGNVGVVCVLFDRSIATTTTTDKAGSLVSQRRKQRFQKSAIALEVLIGRLLGSCRLGCGQQQRNDDEEEQRAAANAETMDAHTRSDIGGAPPIKKRRKIWRLRVVKHYFLRSSSRWTGVHMKRDSEMFLHQSERPSVRDG
jgi:hypothetical protein